MILPPAVIIHSLADSRLALAPGQPVTLLSAPAAALFGGCLWWACLLEAAEAKTRAPAFLDCADAPGRAVEAMQMGLKGIILSETVPSFPAVAALAEHYGAVLLPAAPPALDLAERGADRNLAAWLASGP